jgi:hypothetical protein
MWCVSISVIISLRVVPSSVNEEEHSHLAAIHVYMVFIQYTRSQMDLHFICQVHHRVHPKRLCSRIITSLILHIAIGC